MYAAHRAFSAPHEAPNSGTFGVPSPFVQFSSATMDEHQHTLDRLASQLEMIVRALADLEGEGARHASEHGMAIEGMAREQDELIRRAHQCKGMAGALAAELQQEEGRLAAEAAAALSRDNGAADELRQLEDLEQEMLALEQSARDRLALTHRQIGLFTQALREGLDVLETDASEVRRIMTSAHRATSADYSRPVTPSSAQVRLPFDRHVAITPVAHSTIGTPRRHLSPVRQPAPAGGAWRPTPAVGNVSGHLPMASPERASNASRLPSASFSSLPFPTSENTQRETPAVAHGLSIPGSRELLDACSRVPLDPNEVTFLLRQNQAAVNALDSLDNTPLHLACMNPAPSLDAVHALLLAGANASLKNAAGLTPFHVACLNFKGDPSSEDHKLKRFLIFKGAQNPNQRTSRGETSAHLCAEDDRHFDSLVFLIGAGVDAAAPALLTGADGSTRPMTAIDVAQAGGGRALKNAEFLSIHCSSL